MATQLTNWNNEVSTLLAKSRVFTDNLYNTPELNKYLDWPLSQAGAALCGQIEKTLLATIALWSNPLACAWDELDLANHSRTTLSVIEAMTCDYVYRSNKAPPSGPLWDYLEQKIDMPAALSMLRNAFAARSQAYPEITNRVCQRLSLVALCRPNVPYSLSDTACHQDIWDDADELQHFWGTHDNPDAAKHLSLVRGMAAFPSSIGAFYKYAAAIPIPDASVQYAFEYFTPVQGPSRVDSAGDEVMPNWCGWLASLQSRPIHWAEACTRWPDTTGLVQIVSALEEPNLVGTRVWELQRQQHDTSLEIGRIEASALFGQQ